MVDQASATTPVVPGKCGVCQRELSGEGLLMCSRCKALYHPECWTYNGGRCAIFGCAAQRGATSQAPPANPQPEPVQPAATGTVQSASSGTSDQSSGFGVVGTFAALIGLFPGYVLFESLVKGKVDILADQIYQHPLRLLDCLLGVFPILWVLSYSSELRKAQRRIAKFGGITLAFWAIHFIALQAGVESKHLEDGKSRVSKEEDRHRFSAEERELNTHAKTISPPPFQRPSTPSAAVVDSDTEGPKRNEIQLSNFTWRPVAKRSLDSDEIAAGVNGYTHWVELSVANNSLTHDATKVILRFGFEDKDGKLLHTPQQNILKPFSARDPGVTYGRIPSGQVFYFKIPIVAPPSAITCGITLIAVSGQPKGQ